MLLLTALIDGDGVLDAAVVELEDSGSLVACKDCNNVSSLSSLESSLEMNAHIKSFKLAI